MKIAPIRLLRIPTPTVFCLSPSSSEVQKNRLNEA